MRKKISMSDFCKLVHKTEEEIRSGSLNLSNWYGLETLPDNLVVGNYLNLHNTSIEELPDNLVVGGGLNLFDSNVRVIPDNLVVGDWLDLRGTFVTSLPDNFTVGGTLRLSNTGITELPKNLTIGGGLDLRALNITSIPDDLIVGDWLDLQYSKVTTLPDNFIIGGFLDVSDSSIKSLPENLSVNEMLFYSRTSIESLPESVTINGVSATSLPNMDGYIQYYDIESAAKASIEIRRKLAARANMCITWGEKYIKVDGIFSVVDSHHGNVWHVHRLDGRKLYLVTDGENHYAHGETLEEARKDLIYKICDRDKSEYKDLSLNSTLTYNEAIECYRVITGACSAGTKDFCKNILTKKKDKYTIREIIKLTKGQFGNERFKEFFLK